MEFFTTLMRKLNRSSSMKMQKSYINYLKGLEKEHLV
jgi:hypothetical protein